MTAETDNPKTESTESSTADVEAAENSAAVDSPSEPDKNETAENQSADPAVEANVPEFANLQESNAPVQPSPRGRLYDVSVQVAAELGSIRMPIGDILQLGEGSVLELNRSVSEPIDLMAQGVRIARGEVVVIDDCFAIRIKEIESSK